eukprot:3437804-Pleurochrysis_carterae.AAC.1
MASFAVAERRRASSIGGGGSTCSSCKLTRETPAYEKRAESLARAAKGEYGEFGRRGLGREGAG